MTVLGGEKAVRTATVQQLGVAITRVSGANRYDTAVRAAEAAVAAGATPATVLAASGDTFADALAAGPAAAAADGLLLLVGRDVLPEVSGAAVAEHVVGALADAADLP